MDASSDLAAFHREAWSRITGYHGSQDRWSFHQQGVHTQTTLDHGFGNRNLFVSLRQSAENQATFNLCSLNFPLRELFDTFAEQLGVPVSELRFLYEGVQLSRTATPRLCGMGACELSKAHTIEVRSASSLQRRTQVFKSLNGMGAVSLGEKSGSLGSSLSSPLLGKVLLGLPIQQLPAAALVSSYWFRATQRLSLMLQLHQGDVAWTEPRNYSEWLVSMSEHSWQLALADARNRREACELWRGLNVAKELDRAPVYSFAKAAGCTTMKTVSLDSIPNGFEAQWLDLHHKRAGFMAKLKAESGGGPDRRASRQSVEALAAAASASASQDVTEQLLPGAGAPPGFIAPARSEHFKALVAELYRRYFSPDMYYVYPLIVQQQAAFGLDFGATETTLVFGASEPGRPAVPSGAVSWRILRPPARRDEEIAGPRAVLEVLFIAVWEEERHGDLGANLVEWLAARARAEAVELMYVEIGFEQPKAKKFWAQNAFARARSVEASTVGELAQGDAKLPEEQGDVELPEEQLLFFDSNCLRFRDTQQYIRTLD